MNIDKKMNIKRSTQLIIGLPLCKNLDSISSHENKKALCPFYHKKMFLIENECKAPVGCCLTFIFYQQYFYDKIDLKVH